MTAKGRFVDYLAVLGFESLVAPGSTDPIESEFGAGANSPFL